MSIIDGESFEAEITSTLKGREPQKPEKINADLDEAWEALTE